MSAAEHPEGPELQILKAVQALDQKLSEALNRQTRTLTASIQALADRHNEALLQQEKRNATFAERTRVESVAEHGHDSANHITNLLARVATTEKRIVELAAGLEACQRSITEKAVGFLAGANGYLVTFIVMVTVAVIAAVASRVIR